MYAVIVRRIVAIGCWVRCASSAVNPDSWPPWAISGITRTAQKHYSTLISIMYPKKSHLRHGADQIPRPPPRGFLAILYVLLFFLSIGLCQATYLSLKGTVQRDFCLQLFSRMGSSQALYSVSEGFSNLALNSRKDSNFD